MAIKVSLRKKPISQKRHSLYLDFYPPIIDFNTGKPTRRQFLNMYIFDNAKNPLNKIHNDETLNIAEQIRQKRENEINKPEVYSGFELEQKQLKEQGEKNFVEYFKTLADKRKASNHDNWISAYNYFNDFTNGYLKFTDVTEKKCNDFKETLLNSYSKKNKKLKLSQNSAVSYFNKLKATLKQAYKDGLLRNDINTRIECIETKETIKQTLTIEELNTIAQLNTK